MYAKFVNKTTIEPAPVQMLIDNRKYMGYNSDFLLEQGYKPVTFAERPDTSIYDEDSDVDNTDKIYQCVYTETTDAIVQSWEPITSTT